MWRWCIGLLLAAVASALTPQQVVVVYNEKSPLSKKAAFRYAEVRNIPQENMVGLRLSANNLSRENYSRLVEKPLLKIAGEREWRLSSAVSLGGKKDIYALLLMPDCPLMVGKIPGNQKENPQLRSSATLDAELALLGARYQLHGTIPNPSFEGSRQFCETPPAALSVCRIDAPDEETIMRMIEEPAQVERQGLWGWVVVDNGGPYTMGDDWIREVAALAQRAWQPLFHESSRKTLATNFPMMQGVAAYFGWYAYPANGPFSATAPESFRFLPGAIAFHLHSYSCSSPKNAKIWVGALLKRGAAVSAGNASEPYLHATIHPDIFYNRLLRGYTVAEAALQATPYLSWQNLVLGDPLYRPFAARTVNRVPQDNPFVQWSLMTAGCRGNYEQMLAKLPRFLSGKHGAFFAEAFAWYCLEHKAPGKAAEYFRMAMNGSQRHEDKLRNRLLYITALFNKGEQELAKDMMRRCLAETIRSPHHAAVEATADVVIKEERDRERAEKKKREAEAKKAAEAADKK